MAKALTAKFCESVQGKPGKQVAYPDSTVRGLELRVSAEGRKTWSLRYRTQEGAQRRLSLGVFPVLELADARNAALRALGAVADGKDPAQEKRQAKREAATQTIKTFDDLFQAYITACKTGRWQPRRKRKRASSIASEEGVYKRHIKKPLGGVKVESVTRGMVRSLLAHLTDPKDSGGKGIGAQALKAQQVIRSTFNYGVDIERIAVNPVARLAPVVAVKARSRILTDEELRGIWGLLESNAPLAWTDADGEERKAFVSRPMRIAIQLCALLLVRRNEAAGMNLAELDLEQGTWLIDGERMKGGTSHLVPLPPRAVELIKEALSLAPAAKGNARPVFPSPRNPNKSVRADSVTHAFAGIAAAAGVAGASPHDLRRTGSTTLASERLGFTPFIVSKALGHKSDTGGGAAVTAQHYNLYQYAAEKRQALTAWEGLLLEIVGERERPDNVASLAPRSLSH